MYSGLRIGSILGVRFYADGSWMLVLLVITWGLGGAVLPQLYPQWDPALTWGAALAAFLLFFVSVLAHELAHLLASGARRARSRNIILFPFGGMPRISGASMVPIDEMVMGVVGPAASLLLGGILFALGVVRATTLNEIIGDTLPALVGLDPWAMLLLWLGAVNLLLGTLNLIPGFPLDGGRVLCSILWETTKNRHLSIQWASRAGQLISWGLAVVGILVMVSVWPSFPREAILGGFLLCFFGWLLNRAAGQINNQVALQDLLAIVPVAAFSDARVPTVPPNIPLSSLMEDYVVGSNNAAFPVIDQNHWVGLVCTADVRKVPRDKWDTTEVGEVMTAASRLAVARPDRVGTSTLGELALAREMPASATGYAVEQQNSWHTESDL